MEALEKVKAWLQTFPLWAQAPLHIDNTGAEPINCGLFPVGVEELGRKEDLLGNRQIDCRQTFLLRRIAQREEIAAGWLMALQQWVQQQNAAGTAPRLGDVAEKCWVRAEKGRLSAANQTGTATYEIRIVFDYTEILEAEKESL